HDEVSRSGEISRRNVCWSSEFINSKTNIARSAGALADGCARAPDVALKTQLRISGRGERIRTSGPCLPKTVLYQAELLPDRNPRASWSRREPRPRLDRGGAAGAQARAQRPIVCSHSSTRTNFSRGLPGRARPASVC